MYIAARVSIDIRRGEDATGNFHRTQVESLCNIRVWEIVIHLCVVFVNCVCIILSCRYFLINLPHVTDGLKELFGLKLVILNIVLQ